MYVYEILNKINGKRYVGQSINVKFRWDQHRYMLNRGTHENPYLQNAWKKYGEHSFCFNLIEECSDEPLLTVRENFWMQELKAAYNENGYNIIAGSSSNHAPHRKTRSQALRPEGYPDVVDASGTVHQIDNLREFARRNKMTQPGLRAMVVECKIFHYKGWRLANTSTINMPFQDDDHLLRGERISKARMQERTPNVLSPDGDIYPVDSVTRFAKRHGLSKGNLSSVLSGRLTHTKGWKLAP